MYTICVQEREFQSKWNEKEYTTETSKRNLRGNIYYHRSKAFLRVGQTYEVASGCYTATGIRHSEKARVCRTQGSNQPGSTLIHPFFQRLRILVRLLRYPLQLWMLPSCNWSRCELCGCCTGCGAGGASAIPNWLAFTAIGRLLPAQTDENEDLGAPTHAH